MAREVRSRKCRKKRGAKSSDIDVLVIEAVVVVFAIRETVRGNRVNTIAPPKSVTSLEIGEDWDSKIEAFCADVGKTPDAGPGWFLTVTEDH